MSSRHRRHWSSYVVSRRALRRLAALAVLLLLLVTWCWFSMLRMPGRSHAGPLPELTATQADLAALMEGHVTVLATDIGARNVMRASALEASAQYLADTFTGLGHDVQRQTFVVGDVPCVNVWIDIPGTTRADEIVVVGAHYDTCYDSPGANDNGSGVAAVLALAGSRRDTTSRRTLRLVLFVNEEPPYFQTDDMGSLRFARMCAERGDDITAMISVETIGCYRDDPGTQTYPPLVGLFYPSRGDFIAFVGNHRSRELVRRCVGVFRATAVFPSQGAAMPGAVHGVSWSDQWSFWQAGYPAIMVTDTAPFRYAHYHQRTDTPEQLDYERMARVVEGLDRVIDDLVRVTAGPPI